MATPPPNLISLGSINADGTHRALHPADVRGRFTRWRRVVALALLAIYILLPWIHINGHPAVFLDVASRRFHFFGLTFATQDLWVGFFLITGLAFGLFYVTSLFGRVWCGWTCPYTVFLEHVFRRVERWIDGDAAARRKLDAAPWTASKISRRVFKHGVYLLLAAGIAHIFLSYFVSLGGLYEMMKGPPREHLLAFGVVTGLTVALYGCFSWFREQFCVIMCPYGRLQSALTDDHSIVIGYDRKRGEPRGKASDPSAGDCVSCNRCVQVCPTGIDIRNGLQLECVGCAACVDACDEIMTRVKRPRGLIRYDSHTGFEGGKTRLVRPRTIFYTLVLCAGITVFGIAFNSIKPLNATAVRMPGAPFFIADGVVRNQFLIRVINKRAETAVFEFEPADELPASWKILGLDDSMELGALDEQQKVLVVAVPEQEFEMKRSLRVRVRDRDTGDSALTRPLEIIGPDPRLSSAAPLNAKDYIQ
jgi:cytochrome c oxidase accessory protein FixG